MAGLGLQAQFVDTTFGGYPGTFNPFIYQQSLPGISGSDFDFNNRHYTELVSYAENG